MIIGVFGFFILLSDIHSIVSNKVKKKIHISSKLCILKKLNSTIHLTEGTYKKAKSSLYNRTEAKKFDLQIFYSHFPVRIQKDLKFHVHSLLFRQFQLFNNLSKEQINRIGDSLNYETFKKSE